MATKRKEPEPGTVQPGAVGRAFVAVRARLEAVA